MDMFVITTGQSTNMSVKTQFSCNPHMFVVTHTSYTAYLLQPTFFTTDILVITTHKLAQKISVIADMLVVALHR